MAESPVRLTQASCQYLYATNSFEPVTFGAAPRKADVGERRSIGLFGLGAAISSIAACLPDRFTAASRHGPKQSFETSAANVRSVSSSPFSGLQLGSTLWKAIKLQWMP